jgi:hypothetical protein
MAAFVTRVGQFELSYDRDTDVLYVAIGSLLRPTQTKMSKGYRSAKTPKWQDGWHAQLGL